MTKQIKVMQLGSPEGLYGAERWILALVKHLIPRRVESWVAAIKDTPGMEVPLCDEAARQGIKTKVFEAYGRANLQAVKLIKNFILEQKIDILHTHFYKTDVIGLLASRGTPCKVISTPHGWSKEANFKLWCYEMLDRLMFPFFDGVVPLSEELYRPLTRLPGLKKKLHLIHNGVDISEVDAVTEIASEIIEWKANGAFVVGYIGQLIGRKRLDVLVKACASLPGNVNWRLAIVGEGEKKGELQTLTEQLEIVERVSFFGFRQDRLSFLQGFDVFVLPSELEGIPRCLMEAMAGEVAVVATNIPGCTDLITHDATGMLFDLEDVTGLAWLLEYLYNNPNTRQELAWAGRQKVLTEFSGNRMAKEYEAFFLSLLNGDKCHA